MRQQASCLLDIEFDFLNLALAEPSQRRSLVKPHCDCLKANEAFFGERLQQVSPSRDEAYTMVPTTVSEDGTCSHCGYFAVVQPETQLKHAIANRRNSKKAQARKDCTVVGTCVSTGKEIRFDTAKAAYTAGYGAVAYAIRNGRELNGYKWRKANG